MTQKLFLEKYQYGYLKNAEFLCRFQIRWGIWNQHKILGFFDTHINIFQGTKFLGHNSTFCNLKMQMRKKLYIFKHFAKSKNLFFCQYLSFSVRFPWSLKHWSPVLYTCKIHICERTSLIGNLLRNLVVAKSWSLVSRWGTLKILVQKEEVWPDSDPDPNPGYASGSKSGIRIRILIRIWIRIRIQNRFQN